MNTIKVPSCWKDLVQVDFADLVLPAKDAKHHRKNDDDPNAFYDDTRVVEKKMKDGTIVRVELCSGQSNYYGGIEVLSKDGDSIYESDPLDLFEDINDLETNDGEYVLKIEWI